MEIDTHDEDMGGARLDDGRERQRMMVFEDNEGGVDDDKVIIYSKRWGVYMNNKGLLIKGGYSVEVSGYYVRKVMWELVDDNVVEEPKENDEI